MKRIVLRLLGGLTVALLFTLTLLINWPMAGLITAFNPDRSLKLETPSGTLTQGGVGRVVVSPSGWPIALGPLEWQLTWPLGISTALGQAPAAWQIKGDWWGLKSRWLISGGDLSALDLTQLPVALSARWEGELALTFQGRRCVSSSGALTTARLQLLSPTPIMLGQARLKLACTGESPELLLTIEDGDALSLEITAALDTSGGSGRAHGFISTDHPLAEWRALLMPSTQGGLANEQLDERFTW